MGLREGKPAPSTHPGTSQAGADRTPGSGSASEGAQQAPVKSTPKKPSAEQAVTPGSHQGRHVVRPARPLKQQREAGTHLLKGLRFSGWSLV